MALRLRITTGQLPPGTALRDTALAQGFDVSRNTMREALRILRYDGLVDHQVNRGAVVRTLTPADVRDIYAARRAIELSAIRESGVAAEGPLSDVGRAVERAEQAVASRAWKDVGTASLGFHQALVALLASPSLDAFFAGVVARLRLAFAVMADEAAFQAPWVPRDRQIWELVSAGRREAAAVHLGLYLDDSERMVLDVVRGSAHKPAVSRRTRPPRRRTTDSTPIEGT
ncbi:MAG: GntR family transcriptional regulator [Actinomycetota bacterium]|nr:GntR family transcriptional regulator [Actinomycetota bacterium]